MSTPEWITVIGAGLMGHGIAQVFASHGHPVWLLDAHKETLNSAKDRVRANLTRMDQQGVALGAGVDEIVARIHTTDDMAAACTEADFVFEAIFEDLDLKQRLFAELDQLCPRDTVFCSNTSSNKKTTSCKSIKNIIFRTSCIKPCK